MDTSASSPRKPPDLYRLLGLSPLESDVAKIRAAVKAIAERAKRASGQDPKLASRAAKVSRMAMDCLLDVDAKRNYDEQWRTYYGKVHASSEIRSEDASDAIECLQGLLPAGNPDLPFDLAKFLRETPPNDEGKIEEEFQLLANTLALNVESQTPRTFAEKLDPSPPKIAASLDPKTLTAVSSRARPEVTRKLRKRREKSILLSAVGVLVSLAAVLGVMFYVLDRDNRDGSAATGKQPADSRAVAQAKPRRSGLPQVSGLEDEIAVPEDAGGFFPIDGQAADDQTSEDIQTQEPNAGIGGDLTSMEPEVSVPLELSDADKKSWANQMLAVRASLSKYNYEDAQTQLSDLEDAATTLVQKEQMARLVAATKLASAAHAALVQAITGLGGGESFLVGTSTRVALIEGSDKHIVIKFRGERREYTYAELPIGMVYGLLDLQMSPQDPMSKGRKAAFALFQSNRSERSLATAREFMAVAAASGGVPEHMIEVFDDDYQL